MADERDKTVGLWAVCAGAAAAAARGGEHLAANGSSTEQAALASAANVTQQIDVRLAALLAASERLSSVLGDGQPDLTSPHVEAARQALCDEAVSLENEVGRLGQVRGKLLECADMHIHLCTLLADVPQKTDYILPMATYERKLAHRLALLADIDDAHVVDDTILADERELWDALEGQWRDAMRAPDLDDSESSPEDAAAGAAAVDSAASGPAHETSPRMSTNTASEPTHTTSPRTGQPPTSAAAVSPAAKGTLPARDTQRAAVATAVTSGPLPSVSAALVAGDVQCAAGGVIDSSGSAKRSPSASPLARGLRRTTVAVAVSPSPSPVASTARSSALPRPAPAAAPAVTAESLLSASGSSASALEEREHTAVVVAPSAEPSQSPPSAACSADGSPPASGSANVSPTLTPTVRAAAATPDTPPPGQRCPPPPMSDPTPHAQQQGKRQYTLSQTPVSRPALGCTPKRGMNNRDRHSGDVAADALGTEAATPSAGKAAHSNRDGRPSLPFSPTTSAPSPASTLRLRFGRDPTRHEPPSSQDPTPTVFSLEERDGSDAGPVSHDVRDGEQTDENCRAPGRATSGSLGAVQPAAGEQDTAAAVVSTDAVAIASVETEADEGDTPPVRPEPSANAKANTPAQAARAAGGSKARNSRASQQSGAGEETTIVTATAMPTPTTTPTTTTTTTPVTVTPAIAAASSLSAAGVTAPVSTGRRLGARGALPGTPSLFTPSASSIGRMGARRDAQRKFVPRAPLTPLRPVGVTSFEHLDSPPASEVEPVSGSRQGQCGTREEKPALGASAVSGSRQEQYGSREGKRRTPPPLPPKLQSPRSVPASLGVSANAQSVPWPSMVGMATSTSAHTRKLQRSASVGSGSSARDRRDERRSERRRESSRGTSPAKRARLAGAGAGTGGGTTQLKESETSV